MARIFLSSRFDHAARMEAYAEGARSLGHQVTSRWHNGSHAIPNATPEQRAQFAMEDESDLYAANTIIFFAEEPDSHSKNGGRHVEFGMARARGLHLVVVGSHENIFHSLPGVEHFGHYRQALLSLPVDGDPPIHPAPQPATPKVHRAVLLGGPIAEAQRFAAILSHMPQSRVREHLADIETLMEYARYARGHKRTRQITVIRAFKNVLEDRLHEILSPPVTLVEERDGR